jgi:hypothetical protein
MDEALPKAVRLLRPGGRILICDAFRLDTPGRSPIGGGQKYSHYLKLAESLHLSCLDDTDITRNIAPTFDLVQDLSLNLLKPLLDNAQRLAQESHPLLYKLAAWKFKRRLEKMQNHFDPRRNGAGFIEYKTYRIQLLAPQSLKPDLPTNAKSPALTETAAR